MVLILKIVLLLISLAIVEINAAPSTSDYIKFGESRKLKDFQIDFKKRNKRYNLLGPNKWETKKLSYHVSKYSTKIPDYIVDMELKRAFDVWSKHIDLEFHLESAETVEIDIRFETGDHGCFIKFDGVPKNFEPNALAHAFNPGNRPENGDIHFDDDENWTFNSTSGSDLFQNAVHEIGHALGLDHTKLKKAVMFPYVANYYSGFKLDADDIAGVQSLYGIKPLNKWPDVPNDIDSVYVATNKRTFFFQGSKFWRYTGGQLDEGFPRKAGYKYPDRFEVAIKDNEEVLYYYLFKGENFTEVSSAL